MQYMIVMYTINKFMFSPSKIKGVTRGYTTTMGGASYHIKTFGQFSIFLKSVQMAYRANVPYIYNVHSMLLTFLCYVLKSGKARYAHVNEIKVSMD